MSPNPTLAGIGQARSPTARQLQAIQEMLELQALRFALLLKP
jgi:hypothetical protein